MTLDKLKQELNSIEDGLYDKFISNFVIGRRHVDIDVFLVMIKENRYIISAFRWDITKEGQEYWKLVNDIWKERRKNDS